MVSDKSGRLAICRDDRKMNEQNQGVRIAVACGWDAIRGTVDVNARRGHRAGLHVVWYCDDCRAYTRSLDRLDNLQR